MNYRKHMASWYYCACSAAIILIGISNSSCYSGDTTTILDDRTSSLSPSVSLVVTPIGTSTAEETNSGLDTEVVTGIIIGILLIVLFLLVCIVVVSCYIIRTRKNQAQLMEVSAQLAIIAIYVKAIAVTLYILALFCTQL